MVQETIPPTITVEDHPTYIGPLHFNTISSLTFTIVVSLEMKPTLIHLIQNNNQFHGHRHENHYTYLSTFIYIYAVS